MTYRLRYLDRTLELGDAPFTIGRNASCQLTIDSDALISRKHATFRVTPSGVTVEDHDSRNGVIVNGARIEKDALLEPGDTILIGVQELELLTDKARKSRSGGAASKGLAATGIHRVAGASLESIPVPVDYVTIAGRSYAVVPKAEYLRMRKELTALARSPATRGARPASRASPRVKKK